MSSISSTSGTVSLQSCAPIGERVQPVTPLIQRYARREGAPVEDPSGAVVESAALQLAATLAFCAASMVDAFFVRMAARRRAPIVSPAAHLSTMA